MDRRQRNANGVRGAYVRSHDGIAELMQEAGGHWESSSSDYADMEGDEHEAGRLSSTTVGTAPSVSYSPHSAA